MKLAVLLGTYGETVNAKVVLQLGVLCSRELQAWPQDTLALPKITLEADIGFVIQPESFFVGIVARRPCSCGEPFFV